MENYPDDFISLETPRIRKFYERHSKKEFETPAPNITNFLQLLTSPVDGYPLLKLQYMTMRHQDIITSHLENSMSALKARKLSEYGMSDHYESSHKPLDAGSKTDLDGVMLDWDQPGKKLNFFDENVDNGAKVIKQQKNELKSVAQTSNEHGRSLRDITSQMNNSSKSMEIDDELEDADGNSNRDRDGALDIRKRKRKSNQQLKILQAEYERDGFWGKDKILSVARITGLSESQVSNNKF